MPEEKRQENTFLPQFPAASVREGGNCFFAFHLHLTYWTAPPKLSSRPHPPRAAMANRLVFDDVFDRRFTGAGFAAYRADRFADVRVNYNAHPVCPARPIELGLSNMLRTIFNGKFESVHARHRPGSPLRFSSSYK